MKAARCQFGAVAAIFALAISGCGGTKDPTRPAADPESAAEAIASPEPATGAAASPETPPRPGTVVVWSPALNRARAIPRRYSCAEGAWLPIRWGKLPEGTREVVLSISAYSPPTSPTGTARSSLVAANGIVGLEPGMHRLPVGELPAGATGVWAAGFPLCPPQDFNGEFTFTLFALPQVISDQDLEDASADLVTSIGEDALAVGGFTALYAKQGER